MDVLQNTQFTSLDSPHQIPLSGQGRMELSNFLRIYKEIGSWSQYVTVRALSNCQNVYLLL